MFKDSQAWSNEKRPLSQTPVKQEPYISAEERELARQNDLHEKNSISHLTRRLCRILQKCPDMTLNTGEAALHLGVSKRRIYDITNILEGIGFVKYVKRNYIKWIVEKPGLCAIANEELEQATRVYNALRSDLSRLQDHTDQIKRKIQTSLEKSEAKELIYIASKDFQEMQQRLQLQKDGANTIGPELVHAAQHLKSKGEQSSLQAADRMISLAEAKNAFGSSSESEQSEDENSSEEPVDSSDR